MAAQRDLGRLLVMLARWGLALLVIAAPLLYGGIPGWTRPILAGSAASIALCWIAGTLLRRRLRAWSWTCSLIITGLIAQGWFMTWNAHAIYDREAFLFGILQSANLNLPGSWDKISSLEWMLGVTPLLLLLPVAADAGVNMVWRWRFIMAIALAGTSVAGLGLVQRATENPLIWAATEVIRRGDGQMWAFGTFYYHGNAGAFINLALPLAAALVIRAQRDDSAPWLRALKTMMLAVLAGAPFVNVSKGATAISLLLLPVLTLWLIIRLTRTGRGRSSWMVYAVIAMAVAVVLGSIVYAAGPQTAFSRWMLAYTMGTRSAEGRLLTAKACLATTDDAGAFGFGPGTFHAVFPLFSRRAGKPNPGYWEFAHQDYLQTLMEWGWVGTICWGLLLLGGWLRALIEYVRRGGTRSDRERAVLLAIWLSLTGVYLHAIFDFPLQIPGIQITVITLLGLAWGASSWERHSPSRHGNDRHYEHGLRHGRGNGSADAPQTT
jgi:hypothetical protein